jgi:alkylhydroperoxidase family enzyme
MARIKGVSSAQAGPYVKIAYRFTRRSIGKLTGRETKRMIEPLQMYAHVPVLFKGYAKLEQATAKLHRLEKRLHALAELKAATLTHCEYCIDMCALKCSSAANLPHARIRRSAAQSQGTPRYAT